MKRYVSFIVFMTFISISSIFAAYTEDNIGSYTQELSKFPNSYKDKIEALHNIYPNAIFVAQNVYFDWDSKREVGVDFNRMLDSEYKSNGRSLIYYSYDDGYKSTDDWAYSYYTNKYSTFSGSKWNAASKQTISYYLDSRNFLDETHIFMFESLLFHDYQTTAGVEKVLQGTFMYDTYCPGSTMKYSDVIMAAARENNISAYMLASRLRQEQGSSGTSSLISGNYPGYNGYYNYFNIKASGKTDKEVIVNGLEHAKNKGWNTPYKSIVGGASFIKSEYVGVNDSYSVKGQLSLYLQKWDPYGWNLGGHQYMQNITAPKSESETTYKSYSSFNGYKDYRYIFYIPVYDNMPNSTSLPNPGNPNNWLSKITVNGSNISGFDSGRTDYSINVLSSTNSVNIDYVKVANTSKVSGAGNINLTGDTTQVKLLVTAGNGDTRTYTLTLKKSSNGDSNNVAVSEIINASGIKSNDEYLSGIPVGMSVQDLKDKLMSVTGGVSVSVQDVNGNEKNSVLATGDKVTISSGNDTRVYYIVIYGDINGDGSIKANDYVLIKNYIMGNKYLDGAKLKAADINRDGNVKASDYVLVKNNIMGSYTINQ